MRPFALATLVASAYAVSRKKIIKIRKEVMMGHDGIEKIIFTEMFRPKMHLCGTAGQPTNMPHTADVNLLQPTTTWSTRHALHNSVEWIRSICSLLRHHTPFLKTPTVPSTSTSGPDTKDSPTRTSTTLSTFLNQRPASIQPTTQHGTTLLCQKPTSSQPSPV